MSIMHSQKFTFKNRDKDDLQMLPDVRSLSEYLPG